MRLLQLVVPSVGLLRTAYAEDTQHVLDDTSNSRALNIAIIGAGAAGSSTAYYLSQFAADAAIPINLTIFEQNSYIGGRSTTVNAFDDPNFPLELGASIFVKVNHILVDAAATFNLSTSNFGRTSSAHGKAPSLGIWDGHEMVLTLSPSEATWWDTTRLLWKYGLAPIRTMSAMKTTIGKFLNMYDEPVFPFESLAGAAEQVGLLDATRSTGVQFLAENSISTAFAHDVIQASTRVNYAQNLANFHGLETMVCMATDGAMSIDGGNWQIFRSMIEASKATLQLNTKVVSIDRKKDGTYSVVSTGGADEAVTITFDDVVIAAPFQHAEIELDNHQLPPGYVKYVNLQVTIFTSPYQIDPVFFNLDANDAAPLTILTTTHCTTDTDTDSCFDDGAKAPDFFSISTLMTLENPTTGQTEYAYKIFSRAAPKTSQIRRLLGKADARIPDEDVITWLFRKAWFSYPYEFPTDRFERIALNQHLWYTSGMDSFISTMETNALMGKNIARLIIDSRRA